MYKKIIIFQIVLGMLFSQCSSDETELVVGKAKITFDAKHQLSNNILKLSGKVTVVNPQSKKFDIGLVYSSVVKLPEQNQASFDHIQRGVTKSFDFKKDFILKHGKTYYARLFAYDGQATVYGDVFKVDVASKSLITLTKPKQDAMNVGIIPVFEWSSAENTTFDIFLKTSSETNFRKIATGVQSPFTLSAGDVHKNREYQWYVVANNVSKTVSATGSFSTITDGTFKMFSKNAYPLFYAQDHLGNQYTLLGGFAGRDFTFEGKSYEGQRSRLLVKQDPQGKTLATQTIYDGGPFAKSYFFMFKVDKQGNLYIGFWAQNSVDYGTKLIAPPSDPDASALYVLKLDTHLNIAWFKSIVETGGLDASGNPISAIPGQNWKAATNANGETVLACSFQVALKNPVAKAVFEKGKTDIFVIKYDTSGNIVYHHSFGTTGDDKFLDVDIDEQGRVTLAVSFNTKNQSVPVDIYQNGTAKSNIVGKTTPDKKSGKMTTLLFFNAGGTFEGFEYDEGTLINLATDSKGAFYTFYKLHQPTFVPTKGIVEGYYFAKYDSNRKNKNQQGANNFQGDFKYLQLSVFQDTPYLHGSAKSISGAGINYSQKYNCFFAAQINAGTYVADWAAHSVLKNIDPASPDRGVRGAANVFKNTSGAVYLYGYINPEATLNNKKVLMPGFIYKN